MTITQFDETDIDAPALQALLQGETFAPWVRELNLQVTQVLAGEVELALPVVPLHVHGGGVLCGQTMMAAADTAMVLAISTLTGGFTPMTTVQLQTSFLRPIPRGTAEVLLTARILRRGKSLAFGEISVRTADGKLAAQATTTYALL